MKRERIASIMYRLIRKAMACIACGYALLPAIGAGLVGYASDPSTTTFRAPPTVVVERIGEKGLILASKMFGGSVAHAAEKKGYRYPSDGTLSKYLDQPIEKVLGPAGVVYVNALNFEDEVFRSDRPVMVIFYSRDGSLARGTAAFVRVLHSNLPGIKVAAYVLPTAKDLSVRTFMVYNRRYELQGVPTILFYDRDKDGNMVVQGKLQGGYEILDDLKDAMEKFFPAIEKNIMD